eukprot:snap_masked-scaffold_8-processed-gene-11.12-mRNA-1 protein AED:0.04 eAED:0.04 QI:0/0/0/1/1/1/2/0/168
MLKRVKIGSIGSQYTGKSCLIKRYCEERFISKYIATIGVDFGVRSEIIDNQCIKINFFDFSGDQDYKETRNEFLNEIESWIIVYDCSNRASFNEVTNWINEIDKRKTAKAKILVANKVDKPNRLVKTNEGRELARTHSAIYIEASANTGFNVSRVFEECFSKVLQRNL